MTEKEKIQGSIFEAKMILEDIEQPEKSLSFPVILSFLLNNSVSIPQSISEKRNINSGDEIKSFEGLAGGVRFLLQENFFKEGRSQGEIIAELKRQGYHYPKSSIPPTLINLIKKRVLNRIKGPDDTWRYIERK